jgi:DNA-binding MarR family transcriptional regulator
LSKSRPPSPLAARPPGERRSDRALDLRGFTPSALTLLAQKISASASAAYRPRFGIGLTDWRVVAQLAAEPWIAPVRIAETTGLDKAAVSRSLQSLRDAGLVEASPGAPGRRSALALTSAGLALHDRMIELSLERERRLLEGFTGEERARLQDYIERMLRAVERM